MFLYSNLMRHFGSKSAKYSQRIIYQHLFLWIIIIIINIININIIILRAKGDWDFRISDLVTSPDGTDI